MMMILQAWHIVDLCNANNNNNNNNNIQKRKRKTNNRTE